MSALQPYEGNEAYIFVSYCHKDKDFTYSLIENLSTNGYRVWYDNGIHPGDNWLETIGGHLNNSKICIAVISEEAAKSHNCLSEINFALEQRITLVPVIISKFEKTPGLRLLINHTQYINAYDFRLDQQTDTNAFYQKLLLSSDFQACREAKLGNQPIKLLPMQRKKKSQQNSGAANQIVIIEETKRLDRVILIDLATGIVCPISKHTSVGRESYNDLCIPDKTISASHAELDLQKDGTVKVTDLESTNGTYLNGERLNPMVQTTVGNFSFITMADRHMLLLKGESAAEVMDCGFCAVLECRETGEIMGLHDQFILGKENPWSNGAFTEPYISRKHGIFSVVKDGYRFTAGHATNGTTFNGVPIREGFVSDLLQNGDEFTLAGMYHVKYYVVKLQEVIK